MAFGTGLNCYKSELVFLLVIRVIYDGARSKFWGVSGSEDRGGGDNSIQFINIGRVGDKSFKEWRRKMRGGGWKVGDNNILTFLCNWLDKKATLKTAFWEIFSVCICKVS